MLKIRRHDLKQSGQGGMNVQEMKRIDKGCEDDKRKGTANVWSGIQSTNLHIKYVSSHFENQK